MGHHYVPQEYLRGFADPNEPGTIWTYDKERHDFTALPIKVVAQERGYYSEDTERQLNQLVEIPANKVLMKLRAGSQIDHADRATLTEYFGTMLMRVPRRRRVGRELFPDVRDKVLDEAAAVVAQWAHTTTAGPELVARRFAELERFRQKYQTDVPDSVMEQIRDPWPSKRILSCISIMSWRVVSAPMGWFFLTSDNPAFFFGGFGLATPESELTFPLASDLALVASRQGPPSQTIFVQAKPALMREICRRVASGAERFVFYHANEDWVPVMSDKKKPYLSRIQW